MTYFDNNTTGGFVQKFWNDPLFPPSPKDRDRENKVMGYRYGVVQHDPGEGYQQPTNFAQRCYTSQHYIVLLYYITGCPVRAIVDSGKVLL